MKIDLPSDFAQVKSPPIKMHCPECGDEETYTQTNLVHEQRDEAYGPSAKLISAVFRLAYKCVSCGEHRRYFIIEMDRNQDTVQKVGQWPPWDIGISKTLAKRLGKYTQVFKHGLISESQGYGIGAFGYYRRIVEGVIDGLLADIQDLIPDRDRPRYAKALQRVAETRVTETKIKLVKDLLPDSLRPDGVNPLAALHTALSEGLHAKDDQECLKIAEAVRSILVFLTSQVEEAKQSRKQFTDDMRKLLGGKVGAKK